MTNETETFSTDQFTDLTDLVRSAAVLAGALSQSDRHLRALFTQLVNAFGMAMICALTKTYGGGAWRNEDEDRLLQYVNDRTGAPRPKGMRIASLRVLWRRTKSQEWMANWEENLFIRIPAETIS